MKITKWRLQLPELSKLTFGEKAALINHNFGKLFGFFWGSMTDTELSYWINDFLTYGETYLDSDTTRNMKTLCKSVFGDRDTFWTWYTYNLIYASPWGPSRGK